MNYKILYVLAFFLIININVIYAQDIEISMQETINLKDQDKTIDLTIINNSSTLRYFDITAYTAPFISYIENPYFSLQPNASKTTTITIKPLEKSLANVYRTTIEITSENYKRNLSLTIVQEKNIDCSIVIEEHYVNYDRTEENFILDIKINNNKDREENLFIKEIVDTNNNILKTIEQEHTLSAEDNLWLSYIFNLDENKTQDYVYLVYGCYDFSLTSKEIHAQKITEEEPKEEQITFGMVILGSVENIFDSLIFQIFLVIVLILLILSFTTKYIKFVYNK